MSKPTRISYSAVNTFKKCPSKMYLSKQYKPIKQTSAFGFGAAVESAVEHLLRGGSLEEAYGIFKDQWKIRPKNKWEKAKPIFDNAEIEYYNSDFDKNLIDDIAIEVFDMWAKEVMGREEQNYFDFVSNVQDKLKQDHPVGQKELRLFNRIMWYCCRKRGPLMIKAFRDELLPIVEEVIACQKPVNITNTDKDRLTGYIDFILKLKDVDGPVVIDLKTAGKAYEEHDLDASDQLRIYAAAEQINNIGYLIVRKDIKHDKICTDCGHVRENGRLTNCAECYDKKAKTGGKYLNTKSYAITQVLVKTITDEEMEETIEDFSEVLDAIKNGIRWKNPNSCFDYNRKCEYYDHCWKGKKLSEIEHLKKK